MVLSSARAEPPIDAREQANTAYIPRKRAFIHLLLRPATTGDGSNKVTALISTEAPSRAARDPPHTSSVQDNSCRIDSTFPDRGRRGSGAISQFRRPAVNGV